MTCQEFLRVMDPYLDDELAVADIVRVHGHLVFCEPCRKATESEAALRAMIVADAAGESASPALRERILQRVSVAPSGPPSGPRRRARVNAVLAGVASVGLLLGVFLILPRVRGPEVLQPVAAEVAAKHVLYTTGASGLEVVTTDSRGLARWIEGRLGFPVRLPVLARPDEHLLGGRVSTIADAPAAYLLYQRGERRVSLVIAQRFLHALRGGVTRVVDGIELYTITLQGVSVVWWEDDEFLYAVASRNGAEDLLEFAVRCARSGRVSGAADRQPRS